MKYNLLKTCTREGYLLQLCHSKGEEETFSHKQKANCTKNCFNHINITV